MAVPRAPGQTTRLSHTGKPVTSLVSQVGERYLGTCQASHASATQRVQRGTNRPSGKRNRKRPKEAAPRKLRTATGGAQAGCASSSDISGSVKVAVPNVSSARAVKSAIRSSDLRQKM